MKILVLAPSAECRTGLTPEPLLRPLAARHDVVFHGPGHPSFETGLSIAEIVERSGGTLDWIVLGDHDQDVADLRGIQDLGIRRAVWIDDAHVAPVERFQWLARIAPQLAVFTQRAWMGPYADHLSCEMTWIPHGVDPICFAPGTGPRPIDVLLYGRQDPRLYPLRVRFAHLLARMRNLEVVNLPHPGYGRLKENPRAALGRVLRESKLVLLDGGHAHLLFLRYFEAPTTGALCVGEMLDEFQDLLAPLLIPAPITARDEELTRWILEWVERWPETEMRRRSAIAAILGAHTWAHRAAQLERALEEFG